MLTDTDIQRITGLWKPDAWPATADAYAIACHNSPFPYYVERIRHLGIGGDLVIDAGCGSGRWSFPLATAFDKVLGFDFTTNRIATALWLKDRFGTPSITFVEGDIRNLPATDGSADAIYSNSVAVGSIDIETILAEAFRTLKTGGVFYLGLNGLGYAYSLIDRDDAKYKDLGRRRVYNTLCRRALAPHLRALAPGGSLNRPLKEALRGGKPPAGMIDDLGLGAAAVEAAETFERDLGHDFTLALLADLSNIATGKRGEFSHVKAGRDFEPAEVEAAARAVGFGRFEWALDGCLSLQSDDTVKKGPSPKAKPGAGEYEGRLRVFEMLIWKP